MPGWLFDLWILQWFGLIVLGGGLIAAGITLRDRGRARRGGAHELDTSGVGARPEINMSRIAIGGDLGGLLVVVGLIVVFLPVLWGWYAAVAVGACLVALALFAWHRTARGSLRR
jgi:hypothetical protein